MRTSSAFGCGWPTAPAPVDDMIEARLRTRSGCSIASVWETKPPSEAPQMCADSTPSAPSRPAQSAAMSESRYGGSGSSPATARVSDGTPASSSTVERPQSRLSNRIT